MIKIDEHFTDGGLPASAFTDNAECFPFGDFERYVIGRMN